MVHVNLLAALQPLLVTRHLYETLGILFLCTFRHMCNIEKWFVMNSSNYSNRIPFHLWYPDVKKIIILPNVWVNWDASCKKYQIGFTGWLLILSLNLCRIYWKFIEWWNYLYSLCMVLCVDIDECLNFFFLNTFWFYIEHLLWATV